MTNPAPPQAGIRLIRALAALAVLLVVIIGVPVVLAVIGAVPHGVPSMREVAQSLRSRDDTGQYFRIAGAAVVWIAWAVFTIGTAKEVAASIRFRGPRPSLPRRGLARLAPAALVATIAMLFVVAPIALTAPHALAQPAAAATFTAHRIAAAGHPPAAQPTVPTDGADNSTEPALPTYQVRRYDTLWSIAQRHLPGDPADRYKDIKNLNPTKVGLDNEISVGTVLALPADAHSLPVTATTSSTEKVLVQQGDTLSGIAAEHGVSDWRSIWPANADHAEPDGQRFTDPNHIEPDWIVDLPTRSTTTPPADSTPPAAVPGRSLPTDPAPPTHTRTQIPSAPAQPASPSASPGTAAQPDRANTHDASEGSPQRAGWQTWDAVFAGGGVLLAAGILTTLLRLRRCQFRNRRPGRTISAAPLELIPAERALLTQGPAGFADVVFLDYAMRSLSAATSNAPDARMPEVIAVRMIGGRLAVRLTTPHPSAPPDPWTVDQSGCWWSVGVSDELPVGDGNADQYLAPYPTLVGIGHDRTGGRWLLDLEAAGAIALTGDPDRCLDLARFIAAELAVNAWSDQLTVTLVGFGEEVVALNPDRLRYTGDLEAAAETLFGELATAMQASDNVGRDVLTGRMRAVAGDSWMPQVLLVAADIAQPSSGSGKLEQLLTALTEQPERRPIAVVLVGDQPHTDAATQQISLTADGQLCIPDLRVEMTAQLLPAEQVTAFGRLLDCAAQIEDAPMPTSTGSKPYDRFMDAGGALLPEMTLQRVPARSEYSPVGFQPATDAVRDAAVRDPGQAGTTSILPHDDDEYLRAGAAGPEELQALGPRVSTERQADILAADPTLDDDLADWLNPACPRPKLRLIGAVELTAGGLRPPKRISYYTEVAAFIATRDHGATAEQVAAAFDVATSSIYSRINTLRGWLGTSPATGQKYLPDSTQSAAAKARGVGVYEFVGVLVDADLFKRLRIRALALGGTEGLAYLQSALDLVGGQPFEQLRPGGYGWLAEYPLDHHLVVGIVDAAHTACLVYLQTGDLTNARRVVEIALQAAPYEDIPRLDMAEVMKTEGLDEEADRYLREEVCNRSEDGEAPDDIPARTIEVMGGRSWPSRVS
jgi:LysM repeat protein